MYRTLTGGGCAGRVHLWFEVQWIRCARGLWIRRPSKSKIERRSTSFSSSSVANLPPPPPYNFPPNLPSPPRFFGPHPPPPPPPPSPAMRAQQEKAAKEVSQQVFLLLGLNGIGFRVLDGFRDLFLGLRVEGLGGLYGAIGSRVQAEIAKLWFAYMENEKAQAVKAAVTEARNEEREKLCMALMDTESRKAEAERTIAEAHKKEKEAIQDSHPKPLNLTT